MWSRSSDSLLGLLGGYLSSKIGEGLIYDLRVQVFAHVQRQSLAFFTRTQTGALVSRLNNDVIGAQRAFTSTLSGTVANMISALVVGVTMFALSWQVTLLCLLLFPFLLLVSRWVSNRLAGLTREQMDGNADLGNAMTERFNVGGAMLLKLFGRRETEDRAVRRQGGRRPRPGRAHLVAHAGVLRRDDPAARSWRPRWSTGSAATSPSRATCRSARSSLSASCCCACSGRCRACPTCGST